MAYEEITALLGGVAGFDEQCVGGGYRAAMSGVLDRRDGCRLCDSRDLELVLSLTPTPIADKYVSLEEVGKVQESYPLDLFLCRSCGHVQLLDVVDPRVLFGDYVYVTSDSQGLVEHFRGYAGEVMRLVDPPPGGLVVDIGSNDGSLLKFFRDRGMRVLGIDPAREIARRATESGIETVAVFFTSELARQIRVERGPATIITANNVFAHADNMADMAAGVRELLAWDGVFVFEVSYLVDLVEKMLFDTVYHEHLCYHSVKPLDGFLRRQGMELVDVARRRTKGGSLRVIAQLAGGQRRVLSSDAELMALETRLGFDRAETFRAFATRIDSVKAELGHLLVDLQAQGKTVAGYGASATITTLIYHFDLGDKLAFLVDDNPRKQGCFSPGYHIPVLSSEAIYERKPDYVLILAWNYSGPIVKKHQAFLDQGGHFIVPLPKIEVM